MTTQELREVTELREQLDEARDILGAIRSGQVDALVVSGAEGGEQLYVLSSAEQPYRIFLETMSEGAATLTPEGVISYSNGSFARILNTPLEHVIGANLEEFLAPQRKGHLRSLLEQALAGSVKGDMVFEAGGSTVEAELSLTPLHPGGGAICVIASDVTERRRAEEVLRGSEAELKEAQRAAHLGSWSVDLKTGAVRWTDELFRMFGRDPAHGAIPYPEQRRMFEPESWERLAPKLDEAIRTGAPYELELETVRADGSHGWMLARGAGVRGKNGEITGLNGVAVDINQRKEAELAGQATEAAFGTLTDAMPQMVWVCAPDGLNTYFNQQWVDYTGLTLEESHGRGWNTPFHPDDKQAAWNAWNRAVDSGETYRVESRLRSADGGYRWFLMRGVPMRDKAGRILQWFGTCTDVQDLKRAEESLRQLNQELEERVRERTAELRYSEERLTLALRASQVGVWDWNLETDEVWYSPRWKEMLGYAEPEIEPRFRVWEQLVHPDDRKGAGEAVDAVLRGERKLFEVEFRLRHKDGHYVDILSRGFPVRPEAGGPLVRMVGTHFDLTQRKQMEEALHARGRELEAATGQLQNDNKVINVIRRLQAEFIDAELSAHAWNEMLEVMVEGSGSAFGFIGELFAPPAGEPYLTPRALSDAAWDQESRTLYRQFLSGELRFENFESWYGAAVIAGKPVFAHDDATDPRRGRPEAGHPPLKTFLSLPLYSNKEVVGVMAVANRAAGYGEEHVTYLEPMAAACGNVIKALKLNRQRQADEAELRHLNKDLERRGVELRAANKELEAFSYSVSHDLRAPLRAIEGFSTVLLEDYAGTLDAEGNHLLDRMRIASRRMDELIDGLLALSRSGRNELHCTSVDLSQLAQGIAMELEKGNPGRRIEWRIAPGMMVNADAGLLRSALENLLGNSFKFTGKHEQARIEVGSVQNNGSELVYFVRDDGAGFDMRYTAKMFGAFQRFHTLSEFEGTGIGLANVQRIVHRHGGRIWAEGEVEKGATFFFTVPMHSGAFEAGVSLDACQLKA